MFETKRSYLYLHDDQILEAKTNIFYFLARGALSTLGLCESNTKYIARRSLDAIASSYNQSLEAKFIQFSGKEIVYLDRFKAFTGKFPSELLACKTMKGLERLCLSKACEAKQIEVSAEDLSSFIETQSESDLFLESKKQVLKLINSDHEQIAPEDRKTLLSLLLSSPKLIKSEFEASSFKDIMSHLLYTHDKSLLLKLSENYLRHDTRAIIGSLSGQDDAEVLIEFLKTTDVDQNLVFSLNKQKYCGSLLHLAATKGNQQLVDWLIKNRSYQDSPHSLSWDQNLSVLECAVLGGQIDLYCHLIASYGMSCESQKLIQYAALSGNKETFFFALDVLGDVFIDPYSQTDLLHFACSGGNLEIVKYLIGKGFNPVKRSSYSLLRAYPMLCALKSGNLELVKYLRVQENLRNYDTLLNTSGDDEQKNPLHYACHSGNLEVVKYVHSLSSWHAVFSTKSGYDALAFACLSNNHSLIAWVQDQLGIELNSSRSSQKQLIQAAVTQNNIDLLEWLVEKKGFNLDLISYDDNVDYTNVIATPAALKYAAIHGNLGLLRYLVLEKKIKIPSHQMSHLFLTETTRTLIQSLYQRQNWDLNYPVLVPANKSLTLPATLAEILEPESNWKELNTIACKQEYVSGLRALYRFVQTREVRPSTGGDAYWSKMEKYLGHLVDYAKKNPSEQDAIFEILSGASGRCGGVLEEFENLYFLRCKKQTQSDYEGTLKHLAWQWRQQATLAYLAKNHPDVHYAHAIRRYVAPTIGILPPQTQDRLEGRVTQTMIDACAESIKIAYPRQMIQMLFEHATMPAPKEGQIDLRLKMGEGSESFQEALISDIFDKGCINPKIRQEIEKAWTALKSDPEKASEALFYVLDEDDIRALDEDAFKGLVQGEGFSSVPPDQIATVKLLRRAVLHDAFKAFIKKEDIASYLEKIEWMSH
jgi:ankyrin repeat protein